MQYLVLALKLLVVPAGLALMAMELARDSRLGQIRIDGTLLVAALLANQVALTLFAVRMAVALRVFGMALTVLQGLRVHLQSMFYFFVLPMTVGLEVARFAKIRALLGDEKAQTGGLAYALLADRLVGATAALAIALALLPFSRLERLDLAGGGTGWVMVLAVGAAAVGLAFAIPQVREHAARLLALLRSEHRRLASSLAVAVVTHLCFALAIHLAAVGAGLPIALQQSVFIVSAAMLFVVIPVSFAGVSPVEAANFGAAMAMGLSLEEAALFAFIVYLAKLVAAVEGAAWEIFEGGGQLSRLIGGER